MPRSVLDEFRIFILPPLLLVSILSIFIIPLSTKELTVEALIVILFGLCAYNLMRFIKTKETNGYSYRKNFFIMSWLIIFLVIGSFGILFLYAAYSLSQGRWG